MSKFLALLMALGLTDPTSNGASSGASGEGERAASGDETTTVAARTTAAYRPAAFSYSKAGSHATLRVMKRIEALFEDVRSSEYSHRLRIDRNTGHYAWDCSAMTNWVLARSAPKALAALDKERPVASTYARTIQRASSRRNPENHWRRIRDIRDVRQGDIFAWEHPKDFPSRNTGHVGFVLSDAEPLPGIENAYLLRILDASSYTHEDDTREEEGPGGFGAGTLLFVTDDDGAVVGYGWRGRHSYLREVPVYFGRVTG